MSNTRTETDDRRLLNQEIQRLWKDLHEAREEYAAKGSNSFTEGEKHHHTWWPLPGGTWQCRGERGCKALM